MLLACLAITAVGFALWATYMVRYPKQWGAFIDGWHESLRPYGLSFEWMRKMEKGITLKILVVTAAELILCSVAWLLLHPTAMTDFLSQLSSPRFR